MSAKTCVSMSLEDHRILAQKLDAAHRELLEIHNQLAAAYDRFSDPPTLAWQVISQIADLRYCLDSALYRERVCTQQPTNIHCYYPGPTGGVRP